MPNQPSEFQRPHGISPEDYIKLLEGEIKTWQKAFQYNAKKNSTNLIEIANALEKLHESEERQRLILQNANDAIITLDANGVVSTWNTAAEKISGYLHNDVLGQTFFEFLIPPDKRLNIKTQWPTTFLKWCRIPPDSVIEFTLWHRDQYEIPCEIAISTNRYHHGFSILAVIRDVSEHHYLIKKLNQNKNLLEQRVDERTKELQVSNQALRQSQKMDAINQLTGGIAHDFNNILNIILGNIELLKLKLPNDEKIFKRVESINTAANRAAKLTKQLLGVSRKHNDNTSNVNINDIIKEMDNLVAHSLTPQIEICNHFAEELWLVSINADDFKDTLINLIINARDAMNGQGRLILSTYNAYLDERYCQSHPTVKPGEYVQLTIADNGDGISEDKLERIFEPFFTSKPQGKGTGLGLSMVFGFCNRSRGHITVESKPNVGTTFTINLPKTTAKDVTNSIEQSDTLPSKGNETILVVDDEIDMLELTKEALQILGYKIYTASNAKNALERLSQTPSIDILFSDIVMPGGMDGYELKNHVKKTYPHIKVLLTTGFDGKVHHSRNAPRNTDILAKPYTQQELAETIRQLLDNRSTIIHKLKS